MFLQGMNLSPVAIDAGAPSDVSSTILMSAARTTLRSVSVMVDITHSYTQDLELVLVSPKGTVVVLASGLGGQGDDYARTVFTDAATIAIGAGQPPFRGRYAPQQPLGVLAGEDVAGNWRLIVRDKASGDGGVLNGWSLNVEVMREGPLTFDKELFKTRKATLDTLKAAAKALKFVRCVDGDYTMGKMLGCMGLSLPRVPGPIGQADAEVEMLEELMAEMDEDTRATVGIAVMEAQGRALERAQADVAGLAG